MSPQHGQKGDPHGKRMPKRMPPKKMPPKRTDDDEMEKRRKKRTLGKFARAVKGGRARAAAMTPSERSESARKAVKARWAKERGESAMSMSVSVGMPERAQTHFYTLAAPAKTEPLITMEVGSWSVSYIPMCLS